MSIAVRCGRCGGLYEHRRGAVSVEYYVTTKVDKDGAPTQMSSEAELCQSCSKMFKAFIKELK